jgi:hypothetical protein
LQILLGKNNSDFNEKFFESDIIVILGNWLTTYFYVHWAGSLQQTIDIPRGDGLL